MGRAMLFALVAVGACALAGCNAGLRHDNLFHAVYDSPPYQAVVYVNETYDIHALYDTTPAQTWAWVHDYAGHGAYYDLHRWLNTPEW